MITKLTLLSSLGCTLNCDYCILNQKKENENLQQLNIKALQNGEFLKNIKLGLARLRINPLQITSLGIWGQEPTITLPYITKLFPDLISYLPNIKNIDMSTNGTGKPEDIVDFIAAIQPYDIKLFIQWSYDGVDTYRHISQNAIIRNIKKVIKELQNIEYNQSNLKFRVHRVISRELLKNLDVEDYYNNLFYFNESLRDRSDSKIDANFYPTIGFEMPLQSNKEDGERLSKLMVNEQELPYSKQLLKVMKDSNIKSFDEFAHLFLSDKILAADIINEINNSLYCGINYNEVQIMFDGTLMSCENMIFDKMRKSLTDIEKSWQKHQLIPNLLTSDSKYIDNVLRMFAYAHNSWSFIIEHMMLNMRYLSMEEEINSNYYKDEFILFKYALLGLTSLPWCYYSNLMTTGSIYLQGEPFFKFFYNGYIELLEKQYDRMLNND